MSIRNYLFNDYLEDGEDILFLCHRSSLVMIRDFIRIFSMHAVPAAAVWYLFPDLLPICIAWLTIGVARFLLVFQDWYYDAWLITNLGIVGVEWTGYFERTSTRVEYASIEGVSYTVKGFWQTMLNYGDVTLAKLGGPHNVTLKDAINPKRVERNVLKYQEKFMTSKNFKDQEILKQLLADLVIGHIQEHGLPDEAKKPFKETIKKK
ncbi:hypothetical protein KKD70_01645 [Patescibacteria group bacterium]|nr:hypothetical protein [Patescibacteria group bacterium]